MNRPDVEEFLRLHAQAAIATKRMNELRDVLLSQLRAGEQSPPDLPFLLERKVQERTEKDYRTPLYRSLLGALGKKVAVAALAAIEARFDKKPVEQLHVVQNKAYAADPCKFVMLTASGPVLGPAA